MPLYGPRPLIFDRTTSTVEANSLRHPQGDPAIATVFGRKLPANSPHGGRMPDVTRALDDQTQVDSKTAGQPEHASLNQRQLITPY